MVSVSRQPGLLHLLLSLPLDEPDNLAMVVQVVVNLYPFRQTVTAAQAPSFEDGIENIDIGAGTCMLLVASCALPRALA